MYLFSKYDHPDNFVFAHRRDESELVSDAGAFPIRIGSAGAGIYHIEIRNRRLWPEDYRAEHFNPAGPSRPIRPGQALSVTRGAGMAFDAPRGRRLLSAADGCWFGTAGPAWMFRFEQRGSMRFYGLGEKQAPFERSGRAYRFWNVDAWADHPREQVEFGDYDPDYISIPYLIVQQGDTYLGLLCDCPAAATISLPGIGGEEKSDRHRDGENPSILIGAENGVPSLYLLVGPSLPELTRKFQRLTGTVPLPPLWALGYHQSRWGYRGDSDLAALAERFERHRFPADGLWLDIDYMDDYRVFTFDRSHLPDPAGTAERLDKRGFRLVPILDPGVKREMGYRVYDSGSRRGLFCRNDAGTEFVGKAWPGRTVFPDFSLERTRTWWSEQARAFFEAGFSGAWLDMNDPSTGAVDPMAMRFERGRAPHWAYRNQYALLMAKATRDGFAAARPDRRPFLLSRSGYTGAQKYAAVWTGDNFSNYGHLRRSIGKSLNLALSGMPFNGPDVGGFGGHCTEALLVDWTKAAFLFPFFRNHTMLGSRPQEPWAFSDEAMRIVRRFVRLRYTFLPYLYNLFAAQEETGEAVLRPLFYDFTDTPALALSGIDDQFMVGPAILQAPFVEEAARRRKLVLPPGRWLNAGTGRWLAGGRHRTEKRKRQATPLFFREAELIPFQPGTRIDNRNNLNEVGLLCCLSPGCTRPAKMRYCCDDGETLGYRRGERSEAVVKARRTGARLELSVKTLASGFGKIRLTPYTVDRFEEVVLRRDGRRRTLVPQKERIRLSGNAFFWYRWERNRPSRTST